MKWKFVITSKYTKIQKTYTIRIEGEKKKLKMNKFVEHSQEYGKIAQQYTVYLSEANNKWTSNE